MDGQPEMLEKKTLERRWGNEGKAFQVWGTANAEALRPESLVGLRGGFLGWTSVSEGCGEGR